MNVSTGTLRFFDAEYANEGSTDDDGVTPSTIDSAIDSFVQAPGIFCPNVYEQAAVAIDLLCLLRQHGGETELREVDPR